MGLHYILYKTTAKGVTMTTQQHYRNHSRPPARALPGWLMRVWGWL